MDIFDSVLTTAGQVTSNVIDAWGRVKVASYDAQIQPPPQTSYTLPQVFGASTNYTTLAVIGAIAAVGVFLVLRK